ncbi:uncharacterized protein si:ch73-70k4.1 [Chelmon rostratus]|uniref:uncharacterized protein si:ch73-70k4.1 n=1 Tax=Chelmon rostratus TaxID=109905 RepID=UPI001BEC38A5|nr:uncharacterized protein si:ch73-70k4.1 [Chelmon rostratus]
MAEHQSKSKLKRKKCSFSEDKHPETSSRGTLNRTAASSSEVVAEPERSVSPAAVWWNREQLPAVESLWALTLKSALLYQHCDLVPDLPHPSTARPTLKLDERWCDLSEEVAPFPEPSPPSPRTSLSPDPLRLSPSLQDLLAQTEPAPDPPDKQLSSQSKQSHNGKATSLQTLRRRPQPSLHSWEGAASSAGPPGVGGEEERKAGEQGKETGTVSRQLLTNQVSVSDRQKQAENKEEVEAQRSARGGGEAAGGGGGGLQSCPMCLLVFPAGFTQMDCDGHLAQCLSEVNVDVTW